MTLPRARPCSPPSDAAIGAWLPGAHFADAYRVPVLQLQRSAMDHLLHALQHTPPWVLRLLALRNRVVALFGLHAAEPWRPPPCAPAAWQPGDRVGIFRLVRLSDDEVIVGDDDHHLRVLLSLRREPARPGQPASVVLTTVVHLHNLLGRLYMLPVGPAHRVIAPAVAARVNGPQPQAPEAVPQRRTG